VRTRAERHRHGEHPRDEGLWHGAWLALSALGITLAVRAVYVSWLIWIQRRSRRVGRHQERVDDAQRRLDRFEEAYRAGPRAVRARAEDPARAARRIGWMRTRISRTMADLDYYRDTPLGARHGSVIVWAGMRGVVTLAAAQTLPVDTTQRPLLIFVAFL
ncbi:sodium:proton antiporter, partial [Microbacterium sp. SUBG005]